MRISDWSSDVCSSDLLFAFIDVGRAPGSQTHLARLAEHVLDQRWGPFFDNLSRRLQASFGGTDLALWALVLTAIIGAGAYLVVTARGGLGPNGRASCRATVFH